MENFDKDQLQEAIKNEDVVVQGRRNRSSRSMTQNERVQETSQANGIESGIPRMVTTTIRHGIRVIGTKRNPNKPNKSVKAISTIDRIYETNVYKKYKEDLQKYSHEKQQSKTNIKTENNAFLDLSKKLIGNNSKKPTVFQHHLKLRTDYTQGSKYPTISKDKTKNSSKNVNNSSGKSSESWSEYVQSESERNIREPKRQGSQYKKISNINTKPQSAKVKLRKSDRNNAASKKYHFPSKKVSFPAVRTLYSTKIQRHNVSMRPPNVHKSRSETVKVVENRKNPSNNNNNINNNISVKSSKCKSFIDIANGWREQIYEVQFAELPQKIDGKKRHSSSESEDVRSTLNSQMEQSQFHNIDDSESESTFDVKVMKRKISLKTRKTHDGTTTFAIGDKIEGRQNSEPKESANSKMESTHGAEVAASQEIESESSFVPSFWRRPFVKTGSAVATDTALQIDTSGLSKKLLHPTKENKPERRRTPHNDKNLISYSGTDKSTVVEDSKVSVAVKEDPKQQHTVHAVVKEHTSRSNQIKPEESSYASTEKPSEVVSTITESEIDSVDIKPKPIGKHTRLSSNEHDETNSKHAEGGRRKTGNESEKNLIKQSLFIDVSETPLLSEASVDGSSIAYFDGNIMAPIQLHPPINANKTKETKTPQEESSNSSSDLDLYNELINEGNQREDEWLGYTGSESFEDVEVIIETDPDNKSQGNKILPKQDLEQECYELMQAVHPLFECMKVSGRMPLTTYIEDKCLKFSLSKKSLEFKVFCATTLLIGIMAILLLVGIIEVFALKKPYLYYEEIQKLEVDKYWMITMVTLLHMVYIVAWSFAIIFGKGVYLAEFLTRWNLALITTKYSTVSEKVRKYILVELGLNLVYSLLVIIFFIGDWVPAVRGTGGLIAMSIFDPFFYRIRLHRNFLCLQTFGMLLHLYVVFCSRIITVLVLVYCRILENYTTRWNLRLAYRLQTCGKRVGDRVLHYYKAIPCMKLFAENLIVSGFLRHTGKVFWDALLPYFILKSMELVICMYHCASFFTNGLIQFNKTYVDNVDSDSIPVTYTDSSAMIVGSAYFFVFVSVFSCIVTTELIRNCGWAVVCGYGFVRKYGLSSCKTSTERRFILSLQNMFAPRNDFYVSPGIDGNFVLQFWAFVFTYWVYLVQFSPGRLQTNIVNVCNPEGVCVELRIASWSPPTTIQILNDLKIKPNTTTPTTTTTTPSTMNTSLPIVDQPQLVHVPCRSSALWAWDYDPGNYLIYKVYEECRQAGQYVFRIPVLFDNRMRPIPPFQNSKYENVPCSSSASIDYGPYSYIKPESYVRIRSCDGEEVSIASLRQMKRDDCGNLPIKTPGLTYTQEYGFEPPTLHYQIVTTSLNEQYIACCYEYHGLTTVWDISGIIHPQTLQCNIPRAEDIEKRCKIHIPGSIVHRRKTQIFTEKYSNYLFNENYKIVGQPRKILDDCICNHYPATNVTAAVEAKRACDNLDDTFHQRNPGVSNGIKDSIAECQNTSTKSNGQPFYYPLLYNDYGKYVLPFKDDGDFNCYPFSGHTHPRLIDTSVGYLEGVTSYGKAPHDNLYNYGGEKISAHGRVPIETDYCGNLEMKNASTSFNVISSVNLVMLKEDVTGYSDKLMCCFDYKSFAVDGSDRYRPRSSDMVELADKYCNVPTTAKFATQCAAKLMRKYRPVEEAFLAIFSNFTSFGAITDDERKDWTECICITKGGYGKVENTEYNRNERGEMRRRCSRLMKTAGPPFSFMKWKPPVD